MQPGCHSHPPVMTHYTPFHTIILVTVDMDSILSVKPTLHIWLPSLQTFLSHNFYALPHIFSQACLHPPRYSSVIFSFTVSPLIRGWSFSLSLSLYWASLNWDSVTCHTLVNWLILDKMTWPWGEGTFGLWLVTVRSRILGKHGAGRQSDSHFPAQPVCRTWH